MKRTPHLRVKAQGSAGLFRVWESLRFPQPRRIATTIMQPAWWRQQLIRNRTGYLMAALSVAGASLVMRGLLLFVHISNISLAYLFVVLWLAVTFGRSSAVLGAILSFLAYDYVFIPPLYQFTVDDPAEWFSLMALLVTGLVLGQLTATVQARAKEAIEDRARIAALYSLAQLVASSANQLDTLDALAHRITEVFQSSGVEACALILPDKGGALVTRATAPPGAIALKALDIRSTEVARGASAAFQGSRETTGHITTLDEAQLRDVTWRFTPLHSGDTIVAALGVAGSANLLQLHGDRSSSSPTDGQDPQVALFAAFCGQIALAIERMDLREQAIRVEALRESDRLKTALLGTVTHDLRTPLAAIKAATTSLLDPASIWSDAERRELLESMDTSVDRLTRMVANLLDLSRLEAGVAIPEKAWHPLGDVLSTVLDRLELAGQIHQHTIEVDISVDLPLVPLDYGQIEQVFTNLLENAIKYSPVGSVIRVSATARLDEIEARVQDHGVGIPPGELDAIFDKFYRVQRSRAGGIPAPEGAGLGLAICAGIIHAHGGRIWAESAPGHGATFIFTLPRGGLAPQGALPSVRFPSDDDSEEDTDDDR